jgi:hypothetical protein
VLFQTKEEPLMAANHASLPSPAFLVPIPAADDHLFEPTYWLPNELAVTVRTPARPTLEQLRHLTARLNRLLGEVGMSLVPFYAGGARLSRPGEHEGVRPADIASQGAQTEAEREQERRQHGDHLPGVSFFGSSPRGAAIIFYAIRTHRRHRDQKRDTVQIAVDYINQSLQQRNPGAGSLRVLASMPNWLTHTSQAGHEPATGPGAPPMWSSSVKPPSGSWTFTQPAFATLIKNNLTVQHPEEVTVIILDTAMGDDQAVINQAQQYPHNALLQQIVADLQNHKMHIDATTYTSHLASDQYSAGQDDLGRPFAYNMVDHGLFIAGIIRNIAPQVKIKLVRIQNEYGAGDMCTFIQALEDIEGRKDADHIVLNLSLGALPPLEELHQVWFGSTCCCEAPPFADALRTLEKLHLGMRLAIQSLIEQGVVVVAAAGNDSLGKNPPHGPRFPARYDDVLGVAAVNRKGDAAAYSNQANVDFWGSGIATYGGEEPNDDDETLAWYLGQSPAPQPTPSPPDAVHSLYLNGTYPPLNADDQVPPGDPEYTNTSGWAWWSGTSFATAVASGMAAHYVLAGYRGRHVVKQLLSDLETAPYCERLQAPILEVVEE